MAKDFNTFNQVDYAGTTYRQNYAISNQRMACDLGRMILAANSNNKTGMETYYLNSVRYQKDAATSLRNLQNLGMVIDQNSVSEAFQKQEIVKTMMAQMHTLCVEGKPADAWKIYEENYSPLLDKMRSQMDKYLEAANNSAKEHVQKTNILKNTMYAVNICIAVIMVILLIVLSKKTVEFVTRPLQQLENSVSAMSEGRLDIVPAYDGQDEFGSLCNNFRKTNKILAEYVAEIQRFTQAISQRKLNYQSSVAFLGDFRKIGESLDNISKFLSNDMMQINSSAEQITKGAEQIAAVGQSLSQATVEQASSVTELASTINSVSEHVQANAAIAMKVRDGTNRLAVKVEKDSDFMEGVKQDMVQMQAMTGKISEIIKNIETLAFQTNILALNAAVEAARAGEAGKGFAVIASEIRQLASDSAVASKNTSELINKTIEMINISTEKSETAAANLQAISKAGRETAASVDKISEASNNQATSIAQIRQSINLISDVNQENSATAEESAASSEEVMGQMKMLKQLVDSFEYAKE